MKSQGDGRGNSLLSITSVAEDRHRRAEKERGVLHSIRCKSARSKSKQSSLQAEQRQEVNSEGKLVWDKISGEVTREESRGRSLQTLVKKRNYSP